jgi:hypothetical protein
MFFINLFFAAIVFIFQYLSFGLWLAKTIPLKLSSLEKALVGIFLALAINSSIFFFLGHLIGPKAYYFSLISLSIGLINYRDLRLFFQKSWSLFKRHRVISLLGFIAVVSMSATIIFSWVIINGELVFQPGQLHDSVWHIALINKLKTGIPPEHPSNYTLQLTNYHYFYDLIIAGMSGVFGISVPVVYFQFFPFVLTGLLAGSAITLGKRLGGLLTSGYLLFLTFFAGSFAYLIPLFLPHNQWHDSSFWVSQTFASMINPQTILTLALTYLLLLIMLIDLKNSKEMRWRVQLPLILLITSSLGFKGYAFIIFSLLYGVYLLIQLIKLKNLQPLIWALALGITSLPFILLLIDFGSSTFLYEPLWFLDTMITSPDRLDATHLKIMKNYYREQGNLIRVFLLRVMQLIIFYIGNLGIRSLVFALVPLVIFKKIRTHSIHLIVLVGFLFGSIFPLLFIQRGVVWNTIQFWYYALVLANIFCAILLTKLHAIVTQKNIVLLMLFTLSVSVLSLPTVIQVALIKYSFETPIDQNKIQLVKKIDPTDIVIIDPRAGRIFSTAIVSAVTEAQVVYANPIQLKIVGTTLENKEDDLVHLIEHEPENLIKKYPQATKLISNKIMTKSIGNLVYQVEGQLFLYNL